MWYLQVDTLLLTLALAVLFGIGGWLAAQRRPGLRITRFLLVADLALLAHVSPKLAVFYFAYALGSYMLIRLLRAARHGRRVLFVLFCLLDAAPFFYVRAAALVPALPAFAVIVGFSYNMLKAIDGLFFVYYTGRHIPLLTYANFLLFFPVITAGPIFRYRDFQKLYEHPVLPDAEGVERQVKRLIRGLFKKLVLVVWFRGALDYVLTLGQHFYATLALVILSYALLYLDLSGYSDIAIAVGSFTGIAVPENFKKPLSAASFTQFWRRWHVTLSDWIREHIFVVVNGKRLNRYASALIGLLTMLVMSLWHNFSLLAVCNGLYMGGLLALENLFGLTTVDRKAKKPVLYLRRAAVAFLFGINAMFFLLEPPQLLTALGGLWKL